MNRAVEADSFAQRVTAVQNEWPKIASNQLKEKPSSGFYVGNWE